MSALAGLAPDPAPPGTDPAAVAAAITARSGTSFGAGMRILPAARREGMWALYAFARVIDDIADGAAPAADKARLLDAWEGEIAALYAGCPVSAVGLALAGPVARYDLPQAEFLALIAGMRMDAEGPVVAPPMAVLRLYTRRVAGAVGLLSMRIFGAWRGDVSDRFALALGDALQFTNILRDLAEDAAIGRLYMPAELLEAHGIPGDPAAAVAHPALPQAAGDLAALARVEFARAAGLIGAHRRAALAPALLMAGAYAGYLRRMQAAGFSPEPRVRLSSLAKLGRGLLCLAAPSLALPRAADG